MADLFCVTSAKLVLDRHVTLVRFNHIYIGPLKCYFVHIPAKMDMLLRMAFLSGGRSLSELAHNWYTKFLQNP
jgi:hypothetical protein